MLTELHIKNFAIVDETHLDFRQGLTVITGETGAGKSIMFDAIGLVLGDRAGSVTVKNPDFPAEITARFSLEDLPEAQTWLAEQHLEHPDFENECLLRRVVLSHGKSRAYINASPVSAHNMRELGHRLIVMHGQHEHQNLTATDTHIYLLDAFVGDETLINECRVAYQTQNQIEKQLNQILAEQAQMQDKAALLSYQVEELEKLEPALEEFQQLEIQQKKLSQAEQLLNQSESALQLLNEDSSYSLFNQLNQLIQSVEQLHKADKAGTASLLEMITSAKIQLEESQAELSDYQGSIELDPEKLEEINQRIALYLDLSRKHQCKPAALAEQLETLSGELQNIQNTQAQSAELEAALAEAKAKYLKTAKTLSSARAKASPSLNAMISEQLRKLGMPKAIFEVRLEIKEHLFKPTGIDICEFYIQTNPGQPSLGIAKVASGGELARISLALQVACQQEIQKTTLIFDEVDSGIGGPTAQKVGELLRSLGAQQQTLCVTHLPQVAALGHNHISVEKHFSDDNTHTQARLLADDERVKEIARMLGGSKLTEKTLENAKELLTSH
jgi:DNA repair protein RecN (Recombination protein N)